LHGKVSLTKRDDGLGWISVLDNQIAGIAREMYITTLAAGSFAYIDHVGNITEMI